jgi:hypothetical protein
MNCELCHKWLTKYDSVIVPDNLKICLICYDLRQAQGLDQ